MIQRNDPEKAGGEGGGKAELVDERGWKGRGGRRAAFQGEGPVGAWRRRSYDSRSNRTLCI